MKIDRPPLPRGKKRDRVRVNFEALPDMTKEELIAIIKDVKGDADYQAMQVSVHKLRVKKTQEYLTQRVKDEMNAKRRLQGKIGKYRRDYNWAIGRNLRLKTEMKQAIKHAQKMRLKELHAIMEHPSTKERTERSPKRLMPSVWSRILHRTNIIRTTSGHNIVEVMGLMYLYGKEYVSSDTFATEMNEDISIFNGWMTKFRRKGWVNSEKKRGRYMLHYLTPLGKEKAEKIYQFIAKNPSRKRK